MSITKGHMFIGGADKMAVNKPRNRVLYSGGNVHKTTERRDITAVGGILFGETMMFDERTGRIIWQRFNIQTNTGSAATTMAEMRLQVCRK